MAQLAAARDLLERADDLPALLGAAYQGFAVALTALRPGENPDSWWFAGFVMAAAEAANGCDALLFAPSMPLYGNAGKAVQDAEPAAGMAEGEDPAGRVAGEIAALCGLAAVRLARG